MIWDPTAHRRTPLLSFAAARWTRRRHFELAFLVAKNLGPRRFALSQGSHLKIRIVVAPLWPSERARPQEAKHKVCEIVDLLIPKVTNKREAFFLAQTLTKSPSILSTAGTKCKTIFRRRRETEPKHSSLTMEGLKQIDEKELACMFED